MIQFNSYITLIYNHVNFRSKLKNLIILNTILTWVTRQENIQTDAPPHLINTLMLLKTNKNYKAKTL